MLANISGSGPAGNGKLCGSGCGWRKSGGPAKLRVNRRNAKGLLGAKGFDGIDGGGAARWQVAGQERGGDQASGYGDVGKWVGGIDVEKQGGHEPHDDDGDDEPADDADAGQEQAVADKHSGERGLLGTEGHANTDFAAALRDGIGDHAVDADDAEEQGHRSRYAEHDQSERGPRHGALVKIFDSVDIGEGKIRIHRPHRLAGFGHKAFRAGARSAEYDGDIAAGTSGIAFKIIQQKGPVSRAGGRFADAIIVDVADDTDDFTPVILGADPDALPEGGGGIVPIFAGDVFGNHGDGKFLVGIRPGEVAAGHERSAHGGQETGRDELEGAKRRKFAFGVGAAFHKDGVMPATVVHRDGRGEGHGRDAGNRFHFVQDFFFHAGNRLSVFDLGFWNGDAEGLQFGGARKARVHFGHGAEGANHQAGANQENEGE